MPKRRTAAETDREIRIAETTLRLLAKQDWRAITLASISRSARLSLPDTLSVVSSKTALPGFILGRFAKETARRHTGDAKSADPRERLFDATMTFFDVQQPHAAALKKLYRGLQYDPATLLAMRNDIVHVAGELLGLAEADMGLSPGVQAAIFAGILIRAATTWREDDEAMGKTMAQLDSDLRRVERFMWAKPKNSDVQKARTDRDRFSSGKRSRGR